MTASATLLRKAIYVSCSYFSCQKIMLATVVTCSVMQVRSNANPAEPCLQLDFFNATGKAINDKPEAITCECVSNQAELCIQWDHVSEPHAM